MVEGEGGSYGSVESTPTSLSQRISVIFVEAHDPSRSAREMSLKRQLVQSNQLSYGYIQQTRCVVSTPLRTGKCESSAVEWASAPSATKYGQAAHNARHMIEWG